MDKFVLRNYPDDDALKNPHKYSKALAFSPDIIPMYGQKVDSSTLTHPASWRGFTGMPLVGGDDNNVYIRGHGTGGPYVATLRALPNELILWPQVWHATKPVPSGPVVIPGGDNLTAGPHVCDGHFHFRPPHTMGSAYCLVAHIFKHLHGEEEPLLSYDLEKSGVDDFVSFLSKDDSHTFYNVIVADPTSKHVSATTRLRMFGRSPMEVHFRLEWHKGTPVPEGLEVSLVDDRGKIVVPRTPFSRFGDRPASLESSYDGFLTLHIFSRADAFFEPYSGLSLQVFKSNMLPIGSGQLLGALNVIFEPHATRSLRFASPAATQLRELKDVPEGDEPDVDSKAKENCAPIPITKPAATGWWTRAMTTDANKFPHPGPFGYSPDIQPVGTDPSAKDFLTILQDPAQDYGAANKIQLVGNRNNYIYLRGHSTIADIDVQSRLFCLKSVPGIHPAQFIQNSIAAEVHGVGGTVNEQSISVANANQFYVFDKPFVIKDPPQDSANHFCFITEFRQKPKCSLVYPGWPSDHWNEVATVSDFINFLMSWPLVCWRNINWEAAQPGGKECWSWTCSTNLVVPDCAFYSSFFTLIVECDSSEIPPGCTWSLVCDDNKIFPNGVCFQNQPLGTHSPASMGVHFTGAPRGYSAKITLSLNWCDGGDHKKIPPPRIHFKVAMTEILTAPLMHMFSRAPAGSEKWPFYVTDKYPYIGDHPHPSPLPSFKNAGFNTWPFNGALQFPIGQVTVTAKLE